MEFEDQILAFSQLLSNLSETASSLSEQFFNKMFEISEDDWAKNWSLKYNFWSDVQNRLDSVFYSISQEYNNDVDWKINYPQLSKSEYLNKAEDEIIENERSDEETHNSAEGLDDFYEGFDPTFLGID